MPGLIYKFKFKFINQIVRHCLFCWFFILLVFNPITLQANNLLAKEYFVKAAFLYNFARLVEWPPNTFKSDIDPIRICFMGEDPFGDALKTIENKKVKGHPILIHRGIALNNAFQCQILFVSQSEQDRIASIPKKLNQYPVLTVSELPGFAHERGHIRLFLADSGTLSLEVNLDAIIQANLRISSRILTLAKIVNSEEVIE